MAVAVGTEYPKALRGRFTEIEAASGAGGLPSPSSVL